MKTKMLVSDLKTQLPEILDDLIEITWITGLHPNDTDYTVGQYITKNSTGDYTNHPNYSGVNEELRDDDCPILNWVKSCLPADDAFVSVVTNQDALSPKY